MMSIRQHLKSMFTVFRTARKGVSGVIALSACALLLSQSHAQVQSHATFREGLNRVAKSLPNEWNFTTRSAIVTRDPKPGANQVDIVIAYDRPDIGKIYGAVRLATQMMREGRTSERDFAKIPSEYKGMPASYGAGFIESVGKILGYAAAETQREASATWRYRVSIQDSASRDIGSLVVSHTDVMDLVNGRISASDQARVARIYSFK